MKRGVFHNPTVANVKKHHHKKLRAHNTGSTAWRRIRAKILCEELYTCRNCGGYGNQVDHVDGDPMNNFRSNLQTLCHSCHSEKTVREQGGFGCE